MRAVLVVTPPGHGIHTRSKRGSRDGEREGSSVNGARPGGDIVEVQPVPERAPQALALGLARSVRRGRGSSLRPPRSPAPAPTGPGQWAPGPLHPRQAKSGKDPPHGAPAGSAPRLSPRAQPPTHPLRPSGKSPATPNGDLSSHDRSELQAHVTLSVTDSPGRAPSESRWGNWRNQHQLNIHDVLRAMI